MQNIDFLKSLISSEVAGKNNAIHAYDRMVWTVRSGFLTLVFAGWSLTIKSAIENNINLLHVIPYVFMLTGFTLSLAIGAFMIDRNYVRRKFRVITAVNTLMDIITNSDLSDEQTQRNHQLPGLLKISGDTDNSSYRSGAYENELLVSRIIYIVPSMLVVGIAIYCFLKIQS